MIARSFTFRLFIAVTVCCGLSLAYAQTRDRTSNPVRGSSTPHLVVQLGHSGLVKCAAFSTDGRLLASGDSKGVAILWEVATAKEIRRFTGHGGAVKAVAFSPDGRLLATAGGYNDEVLETFTEGEDLTARLWDVATGRAVRSFRGHKKALTSIEFAPDGNSLLAGSYDGTALLWNVKTGAIIRRFDPKVGTINAARFSPDGRYVVTGGNALNADEAGGPAKQDFAIRLWDASTGRLIRLFADNEHPIGYLAFSPDSRFVASSGANPPYYGQLSDVGSLRIWNIETGQTIKEFTAKTEDYFGPVTFSPDGNSLLTGNEEGMWLLNVNSGRADKFDSVGQPEIVKSTTQANEDSVEEPEYGITESVAFSPDGHYVVSIANSTPSGGSGGFMVGEASFLLYDVSSKKSVRSFAGDIEAVSGVTFSEDGHFISSGNAVWDTVGGRKLSFDTPGAENEREHLLSLSRDGRFVVTSNSTTARLRDTFSTAEITTFPAVNYAWISSDNRFILTWADLDISKFDEAAILDADDTEIQLRETRTGKKFWGCKFQARMNKPNADASWYGFHSVNFDSALTPDGKYLVLNNICEGAKSKNDGHAITLLDLATGRVKQSYQDEVYEIGRPFLVVSPDSRYSLTLPGDLELRNINTGKTLWTSIDFPGGTEQFFSTEYAAFSPDSRFLLVGENMFEKKRDGSTDDIPLVRLLEVVSGKEIKRFDRQAKAVFAFSADSRYIALVNLTGTTVSVWDVETKTMVGQLTGNADSVTSVAFSPDAQFILTGNADGTVRIWKRSNWQEVCRFISFNNGDWVVVTPDGRFDTNNLEEIRGLHWVMPDDPFTPLSLEIFMRQYYEPRLLARVMAGEDFKPVPSLASLNRSQPLVKITRIEPRKDAPEKVSITVEVNKTEQTGVYDLRLFRDGQLVDYAPRAMEENNAGSSGQSANSGLDQWRGATAIKLDSTGKAVLTFDNVKLPRHQNVKQVEFSAYAFNVDKVKSATDRKTYDIPQSLAPVKGRAYIITVGVNAYENPDFNLDFAANDARRMQQALSEKIAATGQYEKIVPVSLISDYEIKDGQKVATHKQATKDNFRAVLELLSGRAAKSSLPEGILNIDQLSQATPDDLVLILYSSHGYKDDRTGDFYFIPYDTGTGKGKIFTEEVRQRSISSEEVSLWLRDVDAGEMVLIVDACHSTAAVEGQEFKPGPMGSRGLGQLSYDKGMRILTATQADNIALENNLVKQGLLTYALIRDGVEAKQADFKPKDNRIMLLEWLQYGVERVPGLFDEVKSGKVQSFGMASDQTKVAVISGGKQLEEVIGTAATEAKTQQPSLFDFARRRRDVVLVK